MAWAGKAWEAGFRFTLYYNAGNILRHSWARFLQERVTEINPPFRVDLQPVDLPEYRSLLAQRKLPIFTAGWLVDYPDPHDFVHPMMHSKGIYPHLQSYANAEVDQLVEAGARELNADRRRDIYYRLQEIAFDEAKDIYTVEPLGLAVLRDWVHGWEYDLIHGPQAITLFYELNKG
jgi:peptide/nickel transport system substrate-binding protein